MTIGFRNAILTWVFRLLSRPDYCVQNSTTNINIPIGLEPSPLKPVLYVWHSKWPDYISEWNLQSGHDVASVLNELIEIRNFPSFLPLIHQVHLQMSHLIWYQHVWSVKVNDTESEMCMKTKRYQIHPPSEWNPTNSFPSWCLKIQRKNGFYCLLNLGLRQIEIIILEGCSTPLKISTPDSLGT